MNIKVDYPPNYQKIKTFFNPSKGTYFTYGDTIFNPDNAPLDPPLLAHEFVHYIQQEKLGAENWWNRYFIDPPFRLSQELEAYRVQYHEGMKIINDKNHLARWLNLLAWELSGKLYGEIIPFNKAIEAIKSDRPIEFKL